MKGRSITSQRPDEILQADSPAIDQTRTIWSRIQLQIEIDLHEIEAVVSRLLEEPLEALEQEAIRTATKGLASKLEDIGLPVAAEMVGTIGRIVSSEGASAAEAFEAAAGLEDLRTVLAETNATVGVDETLSHHVVAFGEPDIHLDMLLFLLAGRGCSVRYSVQDESDALSASVVVLSVASKDSMAATARARAAKQAHPSAPIIALRAMSDEPLPATACGPLYALLDADRVKEAAEEVVQAIARFEISQSVMIANANPLAQEEISSRLFEASSTDVRAGAERVVDDLRSSNARCLYVTDAERSLCRDIARLVKTDPALRPTALVVKPKEPLKHHEHIAMLRNGFDEVLSFDASTEVVRTVLAAQLRRRSNLETVSTSTRVSSVLPASSLRLLGERLLVAEARMNRQVSVAVVQLTGDTPAQVLQDTIGPLAREFRREDLTGWHADRSAVVMLPGLPRHAAVNRFMGIAERLELSSDVARIGIAEFPSDGRTLAGLITSATGTIFDAEEQGGPHVVTTDWRPSETVGADVLIVDPDPALRAVVATVLTERGFTFAECENGPDALEYLTGPDRPSTPKAVLLEFDLEGIDGIRLLRLLRDAGVLGRFETIMLASRTEELELQECFRLGAIDVIRKPFAPLILGQRVQRVIEQA